MRPLTQNSNPKQQVKNPFDVHFVKSKHKVIGKLPNTKQTLRSVSNTKREKKLSEKAKKLSKIGKFSDFRTKNDQNKYKKRQSVFNLSDSEEVEDMSKSLSQIETFDQNVDESENESEDNSQNDQFVRINSKSDRLTEIIHKSKLNNAKKRQINDKKADFLDELDMEWKEVDYSIKNKSNPLTNHKQTTIPAPKSGDFDSLLQNLKFNPIKKTVKVVKEVTVIPKNIPKEPTNVQAIKRAIMQSADALDDDDEFYGDYEHIPTLHPKPGPTPHKEMYKLTPFLECLCTVEQVIAALVSSAVICQLVKEDKTFVPQLIGASTRILGMFIPQEGIYLGGFKTFSDKFIETPLVQVWSCTLDDNLRFQILHTVVSQGLFIMEMYSHVSTFSEIFAPLRSNAFQVSAISNLPSSILKLVLRIVERFDYFSNSLKVPLVFPQKKMQPIRQIVPLVGKIVKANKSCEQSLVVDKRKRRAMLREIRRDSGCQARLQLQEIISADKERNRKTKDIENMLSMLEGDYNASKRDRLELD